MNEKTLMLYASELLFAGILGGSLAVAWVVPVVAIDPPNPSPARHFRIRNRVLRPRRRFRQRRHSLVRVRRSLHPHRRPRILHRE